MKILRVLGTLGQDSSLLYMTRWSPYCDGFLSHSKKETFQLDKAKVTYNNLFTFHWEQSKHKVTQS